MTNREKINKMTNEELAEIIDYSSCEICVYSKLPCYGIDCKVGIELWLGREVKEDEVKQSN